MEGVEPPEKPILSRLRMPFRHTGKIVVSRKLLVISRLFVKLTTNNFFIPAEGLEPPNT